MLEITFVAICTTILHYLLMEVFLKKNLSKQFYLTFFVIMYLVLSVNKLSAKNHDKVIVYNKQSVMIPSYMNFYSEFDFIHEHLMRLELYDVSKDIYLSFEKHGISSLFCDSVHDIFINHNIIHMYEYELLARHVDIMRYHAEQYEKFINQTTIESKEVHPSLRQAYIDEMNMHKREGLRNLKNVEEACWWAPDLDQRDLSRRCWNAIIAAIGAPGDLSSRFCTVCFVLIGQYGLDCLDHYYYIHDQILWAQYHAEQYEWYKYLLENA